MSELTDNGRLSILFSLVHPGYLRNFDSSIRALSERGHRVQLLFAHHRKAEDVGERCWTNNATKYGIGYHVRSFPPTFWAEWARWIRAVRDYVRYFRPEFRHTTKLRRRAAAGVPPLLRWVLALPGVGRTLSGRVFTWVLTRAEAAIPANKAIVGYLRHCKIDLLMVSPLVDFGSPQTEYVKAAQRLGIRTALPVASWDNLTNKGQIRVIPDLVAVWNHLQEQEAIRIHRIAPQRIAVTGAKPTTTGSRGSRRIATGSVPASAWIHRARTSCTWARRDSSLATKRPSRPRGSSACVLRATRCFAPPG
jgi:hypothetical protein